MINAGQSIVLSIDADSSLAYDGEDWNTLDWVWEKFHVRAADAGTLTVDTRSGAGGIVPSLALFCIWVVDNCADSPWVQVPAGTGKGSRRVQADSRFEVRVAIPTRVAPQRYEVATSLQP
jgi:hypothetical protein